MKTIGLIGGMSWESSKVYYEYINRLTQQKLGGSHSAKSIMTSLDYQEIEHLSFEGNWDAIGKLMASHARKLELAGAELILLCSNTIHLVHENITKVTTIPFLHIADVTGLAVQQRNVKKVALLGTKFTMEKDFYKEILEKEYGLEVVVPDLDGRNTVHDIIYNELVKGIINKESKQKLVALCNELLDMGAEGIILGCTELPLLIAEGDVQAPTFNTTHIHALQAVNFALDTLKMVNK